MSEARGGWTERASGYWIRGATAGGAGRAAIVRCGTTYYLILNHPFLPRASIGAFATLEKALDAAGAGEWALLVDSEARRSP